MGDDQDDFSKEIKEKIDVTIIGKTVETLQDINSIIEKDKAKDIDQITKEDL